jgi:hypothetical protein
MIEMKDIRVLRNYTVSQGFGEHNPLRKCKQLYFHDITKVIHRYLAILTQIYECTVD